MNASGHAPASSIDDLSERCGCDPGSGPDLQFLLNTDNLNTHALLLLYLMPVANQSDADAKTMGAVEMLSDVQCRLAVDPDYGLSNRDTLSVLYSTVASIRFGTC